MILEGIKSIISLNTKESESPKIILNKKGEFLTNPNGIANQFNNIFCSVAPTIQSNLKSNFKACVCYFSLFLKEQYVSWLFPMKYFEMKFNLQLLYLPIV